MSEPVDLAEQQADELEAIETAAAAAALGNLVAELDALLRRALAVVGLSPNAWLQILDRLDRIFAGAPERAESSVRDGTRDAYLAGLRHAVSGLEGIEPLELVPPDVEVGAGRMVAEQHAAARLMMRSNDDVVAAIQVARRAESRVKAATAWHVTRAAADAVENTAEELGLLRRWVAERDACVHCLAYQGEVAAPGSGFRGGLSFDVRPLTGLEEMVANPPLHPHCRCSTQLHHPRDTMVITALKREARRSVVKGWSLPSESQATRLRAADRLLRAGAGLPQTVEREAAAAIKRGAFKSRRVPTTR